jgi:1-pyrroline-5-carboxylate dehydrogenase
MQRKERAMSRTMDNFKNEPIRAYTEQADRQGMTDAIRRVESEFGREWPLVIGGENVTTGDFIASRNPSKPDEVVGRIAKAGTKEMEMAFGAAGKAFRTWSRTPAKERAELLFRAADIMRRRRYELNATMVIEVGKNWIEADADTAEAIDFLEFYGREALRYGGEQPVTPVPGEKNELRYIPLGTGVVIPPWNFPLAILCGMTSAAAVTGNAVILKPSSDSGVIGAKYMEIMMEAGLPAGVINFLPGPGSTIGDRLVEDARTRFIAFTGSKEVGLGIVERAGRTAPGQIWIKRVVAEMGGKDGIIVDGEVDLDAAVEGVTVSAYGFTGQKCSACSRALVHEKVYDDFVARLKKRVEAITVGDPRDQANYMGPVVNEGARKDHLAYIETGKKEGRLLTGGNVLDRPGWFLQPTVFIDVSPKARISQEEIFGPVLSVSKVRDFDAALAAANDTEYGLTGAIFSTNRAHLDRARDEFHVGNLYLNRKCTGALVGGQPFGGFNMSGTDSKAGGRDYLLLFLQAKSISEKV